MASVAVEEDILLDTSTEMDLDLLNEENLLKTPPPEESKLKSFVLPDKGSVPLSTPEVSTTIVNNHKNGATVQETEINSTNGLGDTSEQLAVALSEEVDSTTCDSAVGFRPFESTSVSDKETVKEQTSFESMPELTSECLTISNTDDAAEKTSHNHIEEPSSSDNALLGSERTLEDDLDTPTSTEDSRASKCSSKNNSVTSLPSSNIQLPNSKRSESVGSDSNLKTVEKESNDGPPILEKEGTVRQKNVNSSTSSSQNAQVPLETELNSLRTTIQNDSKSPHVLDRQNEKTADPIVENHSNDSNKTESSLSKVVQVLEEEKSQSVIKSSQDTTPLSNCDLPNVNDNSSEQINECDVLEETIFEPISVKVFSMSKNDDFKNCQMVLGPSSDTNGSVNIHDNIHIEYRHKSDSSGTDKLTRSESSDHLEKGKETPKPENDNLPSGSVLNDSTQIRMPSLPLELTPIDESLLNKNNDYTESYKCVKQILAKKGMVKSGSETLEKYFNIHERNLKPFEKLSAISDVEIIPLKTSEVSRQISHSNHDNDKDFNIKKTNNCRGNDLISDIQSTIGPDLVVKLINNKANDILGDKNDKTDRMRLEWENRNSNSSSFRDTNPYSPKPGVDVSVKSKDSDNNFEEKRTTPAEEKSNGEEKMSMPNKVLTGKKKTEIKTKRAMPMLAPKPTPPPCQAELFKPHRIVRVPQYAENRIPQQQQSPPLPSSQSHLSHQTDDKKNSAFDKKQEFRPTALVNPFPPFPVETSPPAHYVKPNQVEDDVSDYGFSGRSFRTRNHKESTNIPEMDKKRVGAVTKSGKQLRSRSAQMTVTDYQTSVMGQLLAPTKSLPQPPQPQVPRKKALKSVIDQFGSSVQDAGILQHLLNTSSRDSETICMSSLLGGSGGAVSIVPQEPKSPITDMSVVDRLKRLGTVIEIEDEAPQTLATPAALELVEKETNSLALLEKITINKPQSPVVTALDDSRPLYVGKDISVYAKKPSQYPQKLPPLTVPVPQVTCTSVPSLPTVTPPEPSLLEPVIDIVEDEVLLSYDGKFIFKMDSFHVDLPNEHKVFSCDICAAVYHHSHLLKKHYFRLHIARKYIPEKDLEAYNINSESMEEPESEKLIFRCHTCRQCFPAKAELKSHLMDHPPVEELNKPVKGLKNYRCENCSMTFKWRKVFARHKRVCTPREPHKIYFQNELSTDATESPSTPPQSTSTPKKEDTKTIDPIKASSVYDFSDKASDDPDNIEADDDEPKTHMTEEEIQEISQPPASVTPEPPAPPTPPPLPPAPAEAMLHHCLYCNETFSTPNKKRNHILKCHPYLRKHHKCVFCKTSEFTSHQTLFTHLLQEHKETYFGCLTCKERFVSLVELKKHSRKKHNLEKDELAALSARISTLNQEKDHYTCDTCLKMFLIESCFKEHKCQPEKEKPLKPPKIRKSKSFERGEKVEKPTRVDPETMFYSQVSLNVRDNLLHHLDGRLDSSEDSIESDPIPPSRTYINFSAGFPSTGRLKEPSEPETVCRVKAPWEKYNFPKSYDGRCGLTSYIKDMSYLDISTQLIMRKNLQNLDSSPSKEQAGEDVPSVLALERLGAKCAESYGHTPTESADGESGPLLGELSGEWVRDRIYICSVCAWETPCLWEMEDHKYEIHPGVHCPQYELVGEQKCLSSTIYTRLSKAKPPFHGFRLPTLLPLSAVKCTRCSVGGFQTRSDLHSHILACAGVVVQPWLPTPKKKRWKRKRRARRCLKRNIPSTPHRPVKLRTKPGDTDTIQKMIANLPPKRSTRRVIGFDEMDLKTRSQSTIQNIPPPPKHQTLAPSGGKGGKGTKSSPKNKEDKKDLPQTPVKETDMIDTSAERGDVLSSLRMMPVSTPREELLEPRQILDKVLGVAREETVGLPCCGCGQKFESKIFLRKHHKSCAYFRECGPNAEHKCKTCSKNFEYLLALIEHSCDDMPTLEIEKDLSPANSVDIPVLSPVQESKKTDDNQTENQIEESKDKKLKKGKSSHLVENIKEELDGTSDFANKIKRKRTLSQAENVKPKKRRRKNLKSLESGRTTRSKVTDDSIFLKLENDDEKDEPNEDEAEKTKSQNEDQELHLQNAQIEEDSSEKVVVKRRKYKLKKQKNLEQSDKKEMLKLNKDNVENKVPKRRGRKKVIKVENEKSEIGVSNKDSKLKVEKNKENTIYEKQPKENEIQDSKVEPNDQIGGNVVVKKKRGRKKKVKVEETLQKDDQNATISQENTESGVNSMDQIPKEEELKEVVREETIKDKPSIESSPSVLPPVIKKKRGRPFGALSKKKKEIPERRSTRTSLISTKEEVKPVDFPSVSSSPGSMLRNHEDEIVPFEEEQPKPPPKPTKPQVQRRRGRVRREESPDTTTIVVQVEVHPEPVQRNTKECSPKHEIEFSPEKRKRIKLDSCFDEIQLLEVEEFEEDITTSEANDEIHVKNEQDDMERLEKSPESECSPEKEQDSITEPILKNEYVIKQEYENETTSPTNAENPTGNEDKELNEPQSPVETKKRKKKDKDMKKKKKFLINQRAKLIRAKRKKIKGMKSTAGKEVVKIAGLSWEVSELAKSPPKPETTKDWVPETWPLPPIIPVEQANPLLPTSSMLLPSSQLPVVPSTTCLQPQMLDQPTPSIGTIIDSVNKLLNEPESTYLPLGLPQYSLADLQRAMGASDAEMAVLQQLGEATCLQDEFDNRMIDQKPLLVDDDWGEMSIMDLDNQPQQQPEVSSSVSEPLLPTPIVASIEETAPPESTELQPSAESTTFSDSLEKTQEPTSFNSKEDKNNPICRRPPSPRFNSSTSLLAAYNGKEVVCPSCSCHFMGFPALQVHVNTVHSTQQDQSQGGKKTLQPGTKLDLTAALTRRVVLNSVGSRLVCFECHQILPSNIMCMHLENYHNLDPSDVSKCSTVSGEANSGPVGGERLKSKMSSALGDLLDKAVNNLLSSKTKTDNNSGGGAAELLSKLCSVRRRDGGGIKNSAKELFMKLKLGTKDDFDDFKPSPPRLFSCTICGQKFSLASSRNKHEVLAHRTYRQHEDNNLFKQEVDEYENDWREAPSPSGSVGETGEADWKPSCSDCGLGFESIGEMMKHRLEDHTRARRPSMDVDNETPTTTTAPFPDPVPVPSTSNRKNSVAEETPPPPPAARAKAPAKTKNSSNKKRGKKAESAKEGKGPTKRKRTQKGIVGPVIRAKAEAALRQLNIPRKKPIMGAIPIYSAESLKQ